jgi:hypothetical protein
MIMDSARRSRHSQRSSCLEDFHHIMISIIAEPVKGHPSRWAGVTRTWPHLATPSLLYYRRLLDSTVDRMAGPATRTTSSWTTSELWTSLPRGAGQPESRPGGNDRDPVAVGRRA